MRSVDWPAYASMGGLILRCSKRRSESATYYRDAGAWGVNVVQKDGALVVDAERDDNEHLRHLHGFVLTESTRGAWAEDNHGYV